MKNLILLASLLISFFLLFSRQSPARQKLYQQVLPWQDTVRQQKAIAMADTLFYGEKLEECIQFCDAYLQEHDEPEIIRTRAYAKQFLLRHEEALEDFKKVVHIRTFEVPAYAEIAFIYSITGHPEEALQWAMKGAKEFPASYDMQLLTALLLEGSRGPAAAATYYRRAAEADGRNSMAWRMLAEAALETGDPLLAIDSYTKAIEFSDDELDKAELCFSRGQLYEALGNMAKAIRDYKSATTLDPYAADFRQALGTAYQHVGEYDKADKVFSRPLKNIF